MNFVYFGYDFMLPAAARLLEDGHTLLGIFTFNCDNVFNFNTETLVLGQDLGVPTLLERPTAAHINEFIAHGCEVFIAAGFPAKIPPPDEHQAYAINLHPSLLPKGRGLMPTPTIIMHEPEAAGITAHKLTPKFDAGDILYQEPLPLAADETVDSYSARLAARGPEILSKIMADLPRYWAEATPQDEAQASRAPVPDDAMRTLDWNAPIETLDKITRAFGRFGALATINGELYAVYDCALRRETHTQQPGTARHHENTITVACADGFAEIKSFEIIRPQ